MRLFSKSFSIAFLMSTNNNCPSPQGIASGGAVAAAASDAAANRRPEEEKDEASTSSFILPQLPESSGDPGIPSIKLGETIRFEDWGPIILNTDGTTRRIANWDQLTEQEKKVTWRRISKRNEERRLVLLEQQQKQKEPEEQEEKEL